MLPQYVMLRYRRQVECLAKVRKKICLFKMKLKINHILSAICIVLAVLSMASVVRPLRFDRERLHREAKVKHCLCEIRKAETAYLRLYGNYTSSLERLVESGLLSDSLKTVPFSDGKGYDISVSVYTGKSGKAVPIMECGASFKTYLHGLDENRIKELTEQADSRGEYPGLKFGDITMANDNVGNWE